MSCRHVTADVTKKRRGRDSNPRVPDLQSDSRSPDLQEPEALTSIGNSACAPACLNGVTDHRLQQIVDAWDTLPEAVRNGLFLFAMVSTTGTGHRSTE